MKSRYQIENVNFDLEGRLITFDIGPVTFCNVYLHAGTDAASRQSRENYCGETLSNLLINRKQAGCAGGDWNCILDKNDATNSPSSKMSPSLKRLVSTFNWTDTHKEIHPKSSSFSHFYTVNNDLHATRIDRQYCWGNLQIERSEYIPVAFSDHFGYFVSLKCPVTSESETPRQQQQF